MAEKKLKLLQWGRGCLDRGTVKPISSRFSAVELQWGRGCLDRGTPYLFTGLRTDASASMGPRLFRPRNPNRGDPNRGRPNRLQWGRGCLDRGTCRGELEAEAMYVASMGPRLFRPRNTGETLRAQGGDSRFNGAAVV